MNGSVRIGLPKFEECVKRQHDGFLEDFTVVLKDDLKTLAKVTQVVDGSLSWEIKIPQYVEDCQVMSYLLQHVRGQRPV